MVMISFPRLSIEAFDGCVGQTLHPVGLKLGAAAIMGVEPGSGERQQDDEEARYRHADCKARWSEWPVEKWPRSHRERSMRRSGR